MADPRTGLWEAYHLIVSGIETWEDKCQPRLIADDEVREARDEGLES
jgi:hypothetical protein